MRYKIRLRSVVLAFLISAFTILNPIGQLTSKAADDSKCFAVSMSAPIWNYQSFSYKDVTVTNSTASHINVISIYTDYGYISELPSEVEWHTDLEAVDASGNTIPGGHRTAICILAGEGDNHLQVENLLKKVKYKLDSYDKEIEITIIVDGKDTKLPTVNGYTVTRGTSAELKNHYYVYVPTDSNYSWKDAYEEAKKLRLMDMQGYLVTITSDDEDLLLDRINSGGAWAGAVRVPTNLNVELLNQDTVWEGFGLPTNETDGEGVAERSVWRWVCGPESGEAINISGSYSETYYKVDNPNPTGYSNWNRPAGEDSKPQGMEPNDHGDEWGVDARGGEYCMSVHYHNDGERGSGRLGWNDLPNVCTITWEQYVTGYFVEFDGLDLTTPLTTVVGPTKVAYSNHSFEYKPVVDDDGNIDIEVNCNNDNHDSCDYKPESDDLHAFDISVVAPSKEYVCASYDSANIQMKKDGVEITADKIPAALAEMNATWDGVITYEGTDVNGNTYGPSATGPTNVGNYTAIINIDCNGQNVPIKQNFEITKAPLNISIKDQTVKKDQAISSLPIDTTVTGLKGADYLQEIALKADTSTVGVNEIDLDNKSGNIIVKNPASGKDVTANYRITYQKGKVTIDPKTPNDSEADTTTITYGQKLADSQITGDVRDPDTNKKIEGVFTWDLPDTRLEVSDSEKTLYDATFVPENKTDYETIHKKLRVKVLPKSIKSNDIERSIHLNLNNVPVLEKFYDDQTGKKLVDTTDYSMTYAAEGDKIKVTIKGNNNYSDSYDLYFDAHKWTGRIETDVVVDTSAFELSPQAEKISEKNGTTILTYKVSKLNSENTKEALAQKIVGDIAATGSSIEGDFKALVELLISNADNTVTAEEKSCAESVKGRSKTGQSIIVPDNAQIGLYFDVSMDIEYKITKMFGVEEDLVYDENAVTDTSNGVFPGAGFSEKVKITVPERLRPASGYTRTYYIIRIHDESGQLTWDVLPVTRNEYDLTFSTDKFSVYALAYVDTKIPEKKSDVTENKTNSNNGSSAGSNTGSNSMTTLKVADVVPPTSFPIVAPKTGDSALGYISLTLIFIGALMIIIVGRKKKEGSL